MMMMVIMLNNLELPDESYYSSRKGL